MGPGPVRPAIRMALPEFTHGGDLPEGVHEASLEEVMARFGSGSEQRRSVTATLLQVHRLAQSTGKLDRVVLFGSYVTAKLEPNDVDIVLVMRDDFVLGECSVETKVLFDHLKAEERLGASVFWIRPAMLLSD